MSLTLGGANSNGELRAKNGYLFLKYDGIVYVFSTKYLSRIGEVIQAKEESIDVSLLTVDDVSVTYSQGNSYFTTYLKSGCPADKVNVSFIIHSNSVSGGSYTQYETVTKTSRNVALSTTTGVYKVEAEGIYLAYKNYPETQIPF